MLTSNTKILNAKTGSLIKQLHHEVAEPVAFNQSHYMAVVRGGDILVYDTEDDFNLVITLNNREGQVDETGNVISIYSLAFSEKQSFLVSGNTNGTVKIWDSETWTSVKQFTAHTKDVAYIEFGQNNLVATSSYKGTIKIWNCDTWELVQTLQTLEEEIDEVAFTQNNMLVVLNKNRTNSKIKIWCSESWSLVKQLEANESNF